MGYAWYNRPVKTKLNPKSWLLPEQQGVAYPDTAHQLLAYTLMHAAKHGF